MLSLRAGILSTRISDKLVKPVSAMASRSIVTSGVGIEKLSRLIREPVTTIFSGSSVCSLAAGVVLAGRAISASLANACWLKPLATASAIAQGLVSRFLTGVPSCFIFSF